MVPHCKQSLLSIYFYIQFVSGLHERLVVIKNIFQSETNYRNAKSASATEGSLKPV